jgi:hypothetical protein
VGVGRRADQHGVDVARRQDLRRVAHRRAGLFGQPSRGFLVDVRDRNQRRIR